MRIISLPVARKCGKPAAPPVVRDDEPIRVRSADLAAMGLTTNDILIIMRGRRVIDGETAADAWASMTEGGRR
jgi:hypothetical protein